jgi:asparagine synthase (glutamine-hydrolysing)
MCGIAAIVNFSGLDETSGKTVKQMTDALAHRGPDGEGFYTDDYVAFGHRRLSVIDLDTGQQPMTDTSGRFTVIFNGEVYNHAVLREELQQLEHDFHTASDTEILLHAFMEWGAGCVQKLNGMFAFIIWDREKKSLFVARDRLGIKPLYFAEVDRGQGFIDFVFASEFNALLCHPAIKREIRVDALEDYLALGYVPDPKTIIRDVHKLAPGHMFILDKGKTRITPKAYWDPAAYIQETEDDDAGLEGLLEAAVKRRMIADVPLGAFLSGGVDSSLIVGLMDRNSDQPIKASTIGSNDRTYDESSYAADIAKHFNLDHEVKTIKSLGPDTFEKIVTRFGEPFADHSAAPTYDVSELARKRVTVSLSGDGADELFGGYRRYAMHLNEEKIRRIFPLWFRRSIFGFLGKIYPKLDNWPQIFRAKSTFESLAKSDTDAYFNSVSKCPDRDRLLLHSSKMKAALGGYHPAGRFDEIAKKTKGEDPFKRIQLIDLMTYLPGDILVKLDRASMACSLEARVPFLDHTFVEWALRKKSASLFDRGQGKAPFKGLLAKLGIGWVYDRPKQGFVLPVATFLREDLRADVEALPESETLRQTGLLNMETIGRYVSEHLAQKKDHQQILWSLLVLEGSLKRILDPVNIAA